MDIFGASNVYRMGGDEFVVIGFESDETFFKNDVERARRMLAERECSVSIGSVYCINGTSDISKVESYTDKLMYKEKEAYYKSKE